MTMVRLPLELEQKLDLFSRSKHISKTKLIKEALEVFFKKKSEMDSYELGKEYFGKYGSGNNKLSTNYKRLLKEKLNAKSHSH